MFSNTLRMKVESSTTSTRIFFEGVDMVQLRHRRGARRLRSDELFDGRKQFIFLYRLGQEGGSAILYGAVAMLGAGARGYHHHRNAAGGPAPAPPQPPHPNLPRRQFPAGAGYVAARPSPEVRPVPVGVAAAS